jgi:hypothetical protein
VGEDIYWAEQADPSDPHWAWLNHSRINSPPINAHAFATKKTKNGIVTWTPLSHHIFLKHLTTAARAAKSTPLQGHSIRIGGTLEYLICGLLFETGKAKGQWASDAFASYLRCHAQVMAPHMQAHPELHQMFLQRVVRTPPELHQ